MGSRRWNIIIKTVLILAFGWYLVQHMTSQDNLSTIWGVFISQWPGSTWILILVIALMPVNWLVEVIKWRILMRPAVRLSWRRAIAGVLSGITFSLFTPNRIGEYGGRLLQVDRKYAWQAVLASLTGSFAQNLIHISFGLIAAIALFSGKMELPSTTRTGLWMLSLILVTALWVTYLSLPVLARFLSLKRPPGWLRRPWKALSHLSSTTPHQLRAALSCGMVRYVIFSAQYMLLLVYFGVDVPWQWLVGGVAVIYLMHTSIPLPPFVDLVARNEVGLLLWAGFGANELGIVGAGLSIWVLNLALPALFGLLAIATTNVLRSLGYENAAVSSHLAQYPDRPLDGTPR